MRNFSLNQNKRSTFVRFHAKKRSTFEEFYPKPKKRSTFEEFYPKPKKRSTFVGFHAIKGPLLSDFTLKKGPLLRNFLLNQNKRSTFVSVIIKLLRNSTLNQKKRSTFVGFHAEKRFTFEKFYTKPIKKGPLLSNFTIKKVHF